MQGRVLGVALHDEADVAAHPGRIGEVADGDPAFSWAHIAAGIVVGYLIFKLPRPLPDVVYIDSSAAAIYEEDPDIDSFKETYGALWNDVALSSMVSAERIASELKEVKRE
jgi:hypothetical protein